VRASEATAMTFGTSHGPRHPLIVNCSRFSKPRRRHSAFSPLGQDSKKPSTPARPAQRCRTAKRGVPARVRAVSLVRRFGNRRQ
jgi:hypothetical protein